MRRTTRPWWNIVIAGLMLFLISACAGSSSTDPTLTQAPAPEQTAEAADDDGLAREQALEEQRLQDEAARRQLEIERNRFVYEDIFFEKNQYRLDEQARRKLEWKADWLMAHPEVEVLIEGHTDEGGDPQANLALGLRRAGEVQSFFLRRGIARERLSAISYGKERPIATGGGEEARAKNRRVRTTIVEK